MNLLWIALLALLVLLEKLTPIGLWIARVAGLGLHHCRRMDVVVFKDVISRPLGGTRYVNSNHQPGAHLRLVLNCSIYGTSASKAPRLRRWDAVWSKLGHNVGSPRADEHRENHGLTTLLTARRRSPAFGEEAVYSRLLIQSVMKLGNPVVSKDLKASFHEMLSGSSATHLRTR